VEDAEAEDYAVIGGSHGGSLVKALEKTGRKVTDLTEKGLRMTEEAVAKLESKLEGSEEDGEPVNDDMVVVLWIMDNSLYFAEDEEGARVLPKRGEDGKYHIEGQLKLASGKKATKALEKFLPVLRRMKKNKKVILVLSPRHICQPCCQEKTHCTNRGEAGFLPGILEGIKDVRRAVRDACHEWQVTNYKVVNGCTLLGLHENSGYEVWEGAMGTDSVNLTEIAYRKIAESITQMSEGRDAVFSGGKRELEEEERPAPTILGRKAWVYGPNSSHGRGGGRGRCGRPRFPPRRTWWVTSWPACRRLRV
jgi:hypothetical protein